MVVSPTEFSELKLQDFNILSGTFVHYFVSFSLIIMFLSSLLYTYCDYYLVPAGATVPGAQTPGAPGTTPPGGGGAGQPSAPGGAPGQPAVPSKYSRKWFHEGDTAIVLKVQPGPGPSMYTSACFSIPNSVML